MPLGAEMTLYAGESGERRQHERLDRAQLYLRIGGNTFHTVEWSYGGFVVEDRGKILPTGALLRIDDLADEDVMAVQLEKASPPGVSFCNTSRKLQQHDPTAARSLAIASASRDPSQTERASSSTARVRIERWRAVTCQAILTCVNERYIPWFCCFFMNFYFI